MDSNGPAETVTSDCTIEGEDFRLTFRVTVPAGPARPSELLPVARALSDSVVAGTCRMVEKAGAAVSCTKGCGACCRNLVAVSEVEARRIRDVVDELPEPRRSAVRARFAEASERLERAGLLETLRAAEVWTEAEYAARVAHYFRQGIPCPFLEDESCSIYEERPIACREYLVTSPPEYCARVGSEGVRRVKLPVRVANAVARWQASPGEHFLESWVPLVLAPEWAEAHPEDPPQEPGPELLRELLDRLGR
jgi:Fe-S-cluster containining protein